MSQNESTTFLVTDAKNLTLIDANRENSPWCENTDGVVCTQKSNGIPSIFTHSDLEEVSHAGFESESTLPGIKEG